MVAIIAPYGSAELGLSHGTGCATSEGIGPVFILAACRPKDSSSRVVVEPWRIAHVATSRDWWVHLKAGCGRAAYRPTSPEEPSAGHGSPGGSPAPDRLAAVDR